MGKKLQKYINELDKRSNFTIQERFNRIIRLFLLLTAMGLTMSNAEAVPRQLQYALIFATMLLYSIPLQKLVIISGLNITEEDFLNKIESAFDNLFSLELIFLRSWDSSITSKGAFSIIISCIFYSILQSIADSFLLNSDNQKHRQYYFNITILLNTLFLGVLRANKTGGIRGAPIIISYNRFLKISFIFSALNKLFYGYRSLNETKSPDTYNSINGIILLIRTLLLRFILQRVPGMSMAGKSI